MESIVLSQLNVYPIKSAGGISLTVSRVEERGLHLDRRWMLVDEDRRFMTQRDFPRISLVRVHIMNEFLIVDAPGMPSLKFPSTPSDHERNQVVIWDDTVEAVPVENGSAKWFSEFLGVSCQLVFMPDDVKRPVDPDYVVGGDQVSFADGFPLLLLSEASLEDLNRRLESPVPMNRFRPNLVVSGCTPFAEDEWRVITIAGIRFRVVKPCARCVITTVDQTSGIKQKEPLHTLSQYRERNSQVLFGQNVIHEGTGSIRLGDAVTVVESATSKPAS